MHLAVFYNREMIFSRFSFKIGKMAPKFSMIIFAPKAGVLDNN